MSGRDDGRLLALGVGAGLALLGASAPSRAPGGSRVRTALQKGPRALLMGVTGDPDRHSEAAAVTLDPKFVAWLKKGRRVFQFAQRELGEHDVWSLQLRTDHAMFFKEIPEPWHPIAGVDPLSNLFDEGGEYVILPPGVFEPNDNALRQSWEVRTEVDLADLDENGVMFTAFERGPSLRLETSRIPWSVFG